MPKMKTNKGAAKRFKRTKNGKIKRHSAYMSHLKMSKSTKQKRKLRSASLVSSHQVKRVRRMLAI